jgi:hypothetical protein
VNAAGFGVNLFVESGSASVQFSSNTGGRFAFLTLADGRYQSAPAPSGSSAILTLGWRFNQHTLRFNNFPTVDMTIPQPAGSPNVATFELFQSGQRLPFYVQTVKGVPDPAIAGEDTYTFSSSTPISWVSDTSSTYWLEIVRGDSERVLPLDACPGQFVAHGTQSTSVDGANGAQSWLCVPSFWTYGGGIRLPSVTQGSAQMTLTSSTTNILNQPYLGPSGQSPIYYGNFTIMGLITFSSVYGSAFGLDALTASREPGGIVPGQYYTAYGRVVQVNGSTTTLAPCYEAAAADGHGHGWLHGIGSLFYGVQNPGPEATGVIELYADGTTAPTGIAQCPIWPTAVATPSPSPLPTPTVSAVPSPTVHPSPTPSPASAK